MKRAGKQPTSHGKTPARPPPRRRQAAPLRRTVPSAAAAAETARAKAYLEAVLAASRDSIMVVDDQGVFEFANDSACLLSGRDRQDFIGRPFLEYFPPDIREAMAARWQQARRRKEDRLETEFLRADGQRRAVTISLQAMRIQDAAKYCAVVRDVTEERAAMAELQRHREALAEQVAERTREIENLVLYSPAVIYRAQYDPPRRIEYITPNVRRFLGYTPEEIMTTPGFFASRLHPEDAAHVCRAMERVEHDGHASFDYRFPDSSGAYIWVHDEMQLARDVSGRPVAFVGFWCDVSENKAAEEALRESEKRYRTLYETTREGIAVCSPEGSVLSANPAAAALLGYPDALALLGVRLCPGAGWQRLVGAVRRDGYADSTDLTLAARGGGALQAVGSAIGHRLPSGETKSIEILFHDVTERRRLERQILDAAGQEQRRLGNILHDVLGQNITGIAFLVRALEGRLQTVDPTAATDAGKILALVNDALRQTRSLARGLCPVDMERQSLVDALQDLAANTEEVFGVSCELLARPGLRIPDPSIRGQLYYIAREAVTNAVKHGKPSRVIIRLAKQGKRFRLTVEDDGRGFAAAEVKPGEGLGLSTMRYRAEVIGAELGVESSRGAGTTVRCLFGPGKAMAASPRRRGSP